MSKNTSKKKYKVDPIIRLAEKNRKASLTAMQFDDRVQKDERKSDSMSDDDLERERFFKEMKRRDF